MADASYERQHLALQAAGAINAAGTSQVTFGCQMTKFAGTGHFGMVLDANSGVINDESFTFVTMKSSTAAFATVEDISNTDKRIHVFDDAGGSVEPSEGIEVILFKSVTH